MSDPFLSPMIAILAKISPLSPAAIETLQACICFRPCLQNEELLRIGQLARNIYYIQKGFARVYYDRDGMDITDYFAMEGQFIGAVASLFTGQPSHKAIQLVEDAEVWYIAAADFEQCCTQHHDIERVGRRLAVFAMLEEQQRIEDIRFLSARERYAALEKKYPGISNRCPLKYIASYLGITQVSLSRIRAGVQ